MNRTMSSLFATLALLGLACSDQHAPERATTASAKEAVQPVAPSLGAVAPLSPRSVLDRPAKAAEVAPAAAADTSQPTLALQEISHLEAEPPKPEDFDRPVDARDVVIDRFVLAHDVRSREPVGESDVFSADTEQIFAFVQLANELEPFAVEVHFEPVDGPKSRYGVKLEVPTAPRYRTWAWTKIQREPGKYRAVLRTLEGEEIAAREFTIDPVHEEPQL